MNQPKSFFLIAMLFAFCGVRSQTLRVEVSSIKAKKGEVLLALFNKPDGFPFETSKSVRLLKGNPDQGAVSFQIDMLPPGKYAIALFHDVNADGKLNLNLLGIPKEGYGVSNNAYNTFSAPRFSEASFSHEKNSLQKIIMQY
jgi:uncharacterized protein (DUF2141 family)